MQSAVDAALRAALDDWLMAGDVAEAARAGGAWGVAETKESVLAIVEDLVERGLMRVGDVSGEGFSPWEGAPADIVARAESMWPRDGYPGYGLFWLELTELGITPARESLARYEQDVLDNPNGDWSLWTPSE